MNESNEYLARLQQALNRQDDTLSPAEQDEILAEIESHIAEGRKDPRMGAEDAQKEANLLAELGSPTDMADGLYHAHVRNRWFELFLALIPLGMVYLVHFNATGWQLPQSPPFDIDEQALYLLNLAVLPIYLLMAWLAIKRQSLMLTLWCLSWLVLESSKSVLWGMMIIEEAPLWARLIWGSVFCLTLALFAIKVWQTRQNGLLVGFSTLPILLSVMQMPILTSAYTYSNPSSSDHRQLWMSGLLLSFYITLLTLLFLLPSRKMRWLSLIGSVTIYLLLLAWLLHPLPMIYLLPYTLVLSLPLMIGVRIDYRQREPRLIAPSS